MPFIKITEGKHKGKYCSRSGRIYTKKEVDAYYARQKRKQHSKAG